MARPRKQVELPGQESTATAASVTGAEERITATEILSLNAEGQRADGVVIQQKVSDLLDSTAQAERNAILSTLNEQAAAIIARFGELGFTDLADQALTDNLEFLTLVKKATTSAPAAPNGYVTNEEGKQQPAAGKPVLTEHGWHVPG
ncbi:hypothetical protein KC222_22300 [Cedecea davisae]|uniref:Mu-like prophage I protein n=1 Tax=Cedecea davisae TaxID=158484 RepID=A0ABS6DNT9_9ENTR|nr:hypothetical protein [Cedecea davisae]MBU4684730.1 hypothetical protein [Cedecea davisae]MBU4688408.1 hypothetical protein [Cedecea davisae]